MMPGITGDYGDTLLNPLSLAFDPRYCGRESRPVAARRSRKAGELSGCPMVSGETGDAGHAGGSGQAALFVVLSFVVSGAVTAAAFNLFYEGLREIPFVGTQYPFLLHDGN